MLTGADFGLHSEARPFCYEPHFSYVRIHELVKLDYVLDMAFAFNLKHYYIEIIIKMQMLHIKCVSLHAISIESYVACTDSSLG